MSPGEKSIYYHNFGDGVRSGEGLGTLRRFPKAPIFSVRHLEGGSPGGKMAKNGQKTCFPKISKIQIFLIHNVIDRLAGLRECGGTKLGHS